MPEKPFPDLWTLLHNPRCTKSRAAVALLTERGIPFRERRYLEAPLSRQELVELERRLGQSPAEWIRRGEAAFADAGLGRESEDEAMREAMIRYPILIERPILVGRRRAAIGRPTENLVALLEAEG